MVQYQVALQVRLGSQRLPGKALLPLLGTRCVLDWVLYHLRQSQQAERFVLLCPEPDCAILAPYAWSYGFELFGGSEQDVLLRFIQALQHYPAQYCFRATADNPLVPGSLLDFMVEQWQQKPLEPDYYWICGLPHGFAAELFRSEALLSLEPRQLQTDDREHVTRFLYRHPERYSVCYDELSQLLGPEFGGLSGLRLTLDTAEDYRFLQQVFAALQQRGILSSSTFRSLLLELPEIFRHIPQKHKR